MVVKTFKCFEKNLHNCWPCLLRFIFKIGIEDIIFHSKPWSCFTYAKKIYNKLFRRYFFCRSPILWFVLSARWSCHDWGTGSLTRLCLTLLLVWWSRLDLPTTEGTNTDADLLCVALYWPADCATELVIGRHRTSARQRLSGGGGWVACLQSTPDPSVTKRAR